MFSFKKKEVIELTDTGRVLAITLGTIFGVGVGTASMYSAYKLADTTMPTNKKKAGKDEEEDE